jgi:hypothetical protein
MHASAVPVRPFPPQQATSTRWVVARSRAAANALLASAGSDGSPKSGHRIHRAAQGTSGG